MTSLSKRVCGLYKKVIRELPMMVDGKMHGIYNSKRVRITGKKNIKYRWCENKIDLPYFLGSQDKIKFSKDKKSVIAIETIQTRDFLRHLITIENILPSIMAAKSYNMQSNKIKFDPKNTIKCSKTCSNSLN